MAGNGTSSQVPVKELRLGLVLYGGVSLAIYMHGNTKELHRLVRASTRPDTPAGGLSASERVYRDLLAAKAEQEGVRTRVVIDIIAGTSAGGINGIYLAKALAHDLPQDALRDLWFERGDIRQLLRGLPRLPWRARIPWVLATLPWRAALRGDAMALWLYDALAGMNPPEPTTATLMPPHHDLQLFVTATDYAGYRRDLGIQDPPVISDHRHRHVLTFVSSPDRDDFGPNVLDDATLAFAARATSCFPGAFPPAGLDGFASHLATHRGVEADSDGLAERDAFRHYPLADASARTAQFIDGGVLDNRPFGHVIDAIRQQPASVQVDRRLIYLDPSPAGRDPGRGDTPARQSRQPPPGPIATVLSSIAGIPRKEPILDDILHVGAINERVEQVQQVIRVSWETVSDTVVAALEDADLAHPPADPSDTRLVDWSARIHQQATAMVGLGYGTYLRAKIADTVAMWAHTLCHLSRFPADCTQAALVRSILRRWAWQRDLFQEDSLQASQAQLGFLANFDLNYAQRRLRFLIAAINWWYDPATESTFDVPSRAQLDQAKALLYDALAELGAAKRAHQLPSDLDELTRQLFGQATLDEYLTGPGDRHQRYLDDRLAQLDDLEVGFRAHLDRQLSSFRSNLYANLHQATVSWAPQARRRFMVRYLGFPIWDALLFPLQSVAQVGERDQVEVVRFSPHDAAQLRKAADTPKLEGSKLHHFGAFFDRPGRERDYLWGRLDAAERMVALLMGRQHDDFEAWCHRAFRAVVEEEDQALPGAADLVQAVKEQLPESATPPPPSPQAS